MAVDTMLSTPRRSFLWDQYVVILAGDRSSSAVYAEIRTARLTKELPWCIKWYVSSRQPVEERVGILENISNSIVRESVREEFSAVFDATKWIKFLD